MVVKVDRDLLFPHSHPEFIHRAERDVKSGNHVHENSVHLEKTFDLLKWNRLSNVLRTFNPRLFILIEEVDVVRWFIESEYAGGLDVFEFVKVMQEWLVILRVNSEHRKHRIRISQQRRQRCKRIIYAAVTLFLRFVNRMNHVEAKVTDDKKFHSVTTLIRPF